MNNTKLLNNKDLQKETMFDTDWNPKDYLLDFYTEVEPDELATIPFFVNALKKYKNKPSQPILFFGTGPTLHHVFLAASYASRLDLSDYLSSNLDEIKAWKNRNKGAHDWYPFVEYTLKCEGIKNPTRAQVIEREELTRSKIHFIDLKADAGMTDPLGIDRRSSYPIVFSPYCVDSATNDKSTWEKYMRNVISLLQPGGLFITAALRECRLYKVGDKYFPSANLNEEDMYRVLSLDFAPKSITLDIVQLTEHRSQGYSGILLAHAVKLK